MDTQTKKTLSPAKPERRRRTRRGEETRRALITAAVDCLSRTGYAATSVEAVMAAAGVSRGSVLNLFPTRLALMSAAADAAMRAMVADTQARYASISDPAVKYRAMCDLFWDTQNIPESAAITEVLLAARWDAALAAELRPIAQRIEIAIDRDIADIAAAAGAKDVTACIVHARILILSLRGITIELMYDPARDIIHRALDRIRAEHQAHCDEMGIPAR
tara:strand:+ start:314654 stop:315310 length:657 start_codon:yes stop_codon:yes gene_type:complete